MSNEIVFENSIFSINKPQDWTSFDVVKKIRSLTKIRKVGHAGTLDPFASGVLLIATAKATKQISTLMDLEKEYIGEIVLGIETDTLDRTGEIVKTTPVGGLTRSQVEMVVSQFTGIINQLPPAFSAIKVNGVRAYKLARKGKTVTLKPRQVQIYSLEILDITFPILKIKVVCSKGTYIRALARDIGNTLGTGGHLQSLTRTRIGNFKIEDAFLIEEFAQKILVEKQKSEF